MVALALAWIRARVVGFWPWLLAAGAVILGILGAALKLISIGREQERAKDDAARLDAIRIRKETDREVDDLAPADVDRRLDEWMRDRPPR